jgi:hypothetical protein
VLVFGVHMMASSETRLSLARYPRERWPSMYESPIVFLSTHLRGDGVSLSHVDAVTYDLIPHDFDWDVLRGTSFISSPSWTDCCPSSSAKQIKTDQVDR